MAISFPSSLDAFTDPTATSDTNVVDHATQHSDVNNAIEALEAKVGSNSSAVTTSHDYKLSGVTGSDIAVGRTATQTVTNKTLTAPVIATIVNTGTLTLPTATTTLVGRSTTDTLTNKTMTAMRITSGSHIADSNGNEALDFTATSSAVNNHRIVNAAAGNYPSINATGSDTDIGLDFSPKAAGPVRIYTTTGNTPTLQAAGDDTNLSLHLKGKGTGTVKQPRSLVVQVYDGLDSLTTGDGKFYFTIPPELDGMVISAVFARVVTAGTTNTTDFQLHNVTDGVDILSTKLTIDTGETSSATAATPAVINASNDDVATNDLIRLDIDATSTTAPKGLIIRITFGFA